jgi:glycosyltransferase involved in cell wall biosynthesis
MLELALSKLCDRIICVSRSEALAAQHVGIAASKCAVIPNGVEPFVLTSEHPATTPGSPLQVAFIGRFDRQKGFDIFIEVMQELDGEANAVAVGDFLIDKQDIPTIPPNVTLVGWQPREVIDSILRRADLLLMPSRWEGMPMVAIEAMRAGTPIFGTNAGGLAELLEDGVTGRILKSYDPQHIADVLRKTNRSELNGFAERASIRFRNEFTSELMEARIEQVYLAELRKRHFCASGGHARRV